MSRVRILRKKREPVEDSAKEPESSPAEHASPDSQPDPVSLPAYAEDAEDAEAATGEEAARAEGEWLEGIDENVAPVAAEQSEWEKVWSDRIATEAQESIARLHRQIAEATDKAMAEIEDSIQARDESPE